VWNAEAATLGCQRRNRTGIHRCFRIGAAMQVPRLHAPKRTRLCRARSNGRSKACELSQTATRGRIPRVKARQCTARATDKRTQKNDEKRKSLLSRSQPINKAKN